MISMKLLLVILLITYCVGRQLELEMEDRKRVPFVFVPPQRIRLWISLDQALYNRLNASSIPHLMNGIAYILRQANVDIQVVNVTVRGDPASSITSFDSYFKKGMREYLPVGNIVDFYQVWTGKAFGTEQEQRQHAVFDSQCKGHSHSLVSHVNGDGSERTEKEILHDTVKSLAQNMGLTDCGCSDTTGWTEGCILTPGNREGMIMPRCVRDQVNLKFKEDACTNGISFPEDSFLPICANGIREPGEDCDCSHKEPDYACAFCCTRGCGIRDIRPECLREGDPVPSVPTPALMKPIQQQERHPDTGPPEEHNNPVDDGEGDPNNLPVLPPVTERPKHDVTKSNVVGTTRTTTRVTSPKSLTESTPTRAPIIDTASGAPDNESPGGTSSPSIGSVVTDPAIDGTPESNKTAKSVADDEGNKNLVVVVLVSLSLVGILAVAIILLLVLLAKENRRREAEKASPKSSLSTPQPVDPDDGESNMSAYESPSPNTLPYHHTESPHVSPSKNPSGTSHSFRASPLTRSPSLDSAVLTRPPSSSSSSHRSHPRSNRRKNRHSGGLVKLFPPVRSPSASTGRSGKSHGSGSSSPQRYHSHHPVTRTNTQDNIGFGFSPGHGSHGRHSHFRDEDLEGPQGWNPYG